MVIYNYKLSYKEATPDAPRTNRRNRQRNKTWFNLPYSKNVETKVGKCFLSLVDQHFPHSNPLHKIFNRNTLKLSYSYMSNIKTVISNHNKAELDNEIKPLITLNHLMIRKKLQRDEHLSSRGHHPSIERKLYRSL